MTWVLAASIVAFAAQRPAAAQPVLPPAQAPPFGQGPLTRRTGPEGPRIVDCAARGVIGETICACGWFPGDSWRGLTLDGRPLADVERLSDRLVHLRLPEGLRPGPHVIGGEPGAGFGVGDRVMTTALRLRVRLDRAAFPRGERARFELRVEGSEERLVVRLGNDEPGIARLEGGDGQTARSSGGRANRLQRTVSGRRGGAFRVRYELEPASCPCTVDEGPPPLRRPFLARRVLAALGPLAPGALEAAGRDLARANGLALLETHVLPGLGESLAVFATPGEDVLAAVAGLRLDPRVLAAQPDFVHLTAGGPADAVGELGYGRALIGVDRLPGSIDGRGVTVALIDTGVDATHSAFRGRVKGPVDLTGKGLAADVHGTLLAGIIVGAAGPEWPAAGVAPEASLLAVKACHPASPRALEAECWSSALVRAVDVALRQRARVVNLSLAGEPDEMLGRALDRAVARGVVVVTAAGARAEPFPASKENVIAVTAVDAGRARYVHASSGRFVDLAAPGVDVLSTAPGNQVAAFSGTSAAAAFVSAAAALVLQASTPGLGPAGLQRLLEATAHDLGPPGKDPGFGSGLLDAARAVTHPRGPARDPGEANRR